MSRRTGIPDRRSARGALSGKRKLTALATAMMAATGAANAGEFSTDNGIEGRWSLNASIGTSIRAADADPNLIMTGNGGRSGSSHDDGNLNFKKGDAYSTIAKVIGELSLKKDNVGLFMRAKGWYDYQLADKGVPFGHSANGYTPGAKLNDHDFDRLTKFTGAELLDAYASLDTELGERPFSVKLGNQVVNWGESLFTPGINQYNAFDISASRRPGAQVKEILLPIPQLWANLGLTENASVEAFYQLRWRKNALDGCGTYWSISDVYNCSNNGVTVGAGPLAAFSDRALFNDFNGAAPGTPNAILANGGNKDPRNSGQWGLAARYFAPALATEFGAYFVNYHQRSPTISVLFNGSPAPSAFAAGSSQIQYVWDWSGENIKVFGLSASTNISGWSVFGEVSRTKDVPVQLNGLDLLRGASSGAGPLMADPNFVFARNNRNQNILYQGYDRKDKSQIQVSTLKVFPRVLAAESMSIMGEVAYQRWSGIGDAETGRRYGRAFVFGQAISQVPGQGATTCAGAGGTGINGGAYCEAKGFATTNAWGYRLAAELSFPDVMAGANLKPRVFWSHDVKGYSADALFVEDRKILGLGARIDYLGKYYADFSYSRYNDNAKYDTFHDRDFYSVVVGMNF